MEAGGDGEAAVNGSGGTLRGRACYMDASGRRGRVLWLVRLVVSCLDPAGAPGVSARVSWIWGEMVGRLGLPWMDFLRIGSHSGFLVAIW